MTREEAINRLQDAKDGYKEYLTDEALNMAIKALEQDAIAQERYEDLCEYFGGVKDILNSREDFKAWLARIKWHIRKAEELYEKYEQEPSGDAISRQATIEAFQMFRGYEANRTNAEWVDRIETVVEKLPPVNPQEPKYCDRNICIQNEYNGIGCNECEVTKSQEPKTGHWIEENINEWSRKVFCSECGCPPPFEHIGTGDVYSASGYGVINKTKYCPNCGARMIEPQERSDKE